ncbi:effector-associated domain EAD1-containing protein [Parafrankia discariae]|uniref:effector-associated domain EAD1-containing protein n=1 Tax=Parafrankia discariae TaxID=365528 RepID=UPI0003717C0A|nr:effector-associated domain EAD1-containing protein [Parafrankia discariae]
MSRAEIQMLATVFGSATPARQLLVAAGVPAERIPPSGDDAASFWTTVSDLLRHGLLHGGRHRVLASAGDLFPGNPVFAAGRR